MRTRRWITALFSGTLLLVCLVVLSARADTHIGCALVSTNVGAWMLDVQHGGRFPLPAPIESTSLALHGTSPDGKVEVSAVWIDSSNPSPDPERKLIHVRLKNTITQRTMTLDQAYMAYSGIVYWPRFSWQWTPSGTLFYTWMSADGRFHMTEVNYDGNRLHDQITPVFYQGVGDASETWSPNGRYFAAVTAAQNPNMLVIRSTADWHVVASYEVGTEIMGAVWSHSGNRLAVFRADDKLVEIVTPDTQQMLLLSTRNSAPPSLFGWSPDDQWVWESASYSSALFSADGSVSKLYPDAALSQVTFAGKTIAYALVFPGQNRAEWQVFDPGTGITRTIGSKLVLAVQNPERTDRYLIGYAVSDTDEEIDVMDADGKHSRLMFVLKQQCLTNRQCSVEWSPDGRSMLAKQWTVGYRGLIWQQDDGTPPRFFPDTFAWKWLDNGRTLLTVRQRNHLYSVESYTWNTGQTHVFASNLTYVQLQGFAPESDQQFGFIWQKPDGVLGVDAYTLSGEWLLHVLDPDLRTIMTGYDQVFQTLYRSPDGQILLRYPSKPGQSFVSGNGYVYDFFVESASVVSWGHCDVP